MDQSQQRGVRKQTKRKAQARVMISAAKAKMTQLPISLWKIYTYAGSLPMEKADNAIILTKVSSANRTNNLLEPPHFRSHLSVELKEQIISKFGRRG